MKFIPILFSTMMVQANLEDRKLMTRRANGLDKVNGNPDHWLFESLHIDGKGDLIAVFGDNTEHPFQPIEIKCPYGQPGDVLWVRETWQQCGKYFHYKASDPQSSEIWRPSIFMPKTAARIFLEITNIKVERLQDITEEDAKAEGVQVDEIQKNTFEFARSAVNDSFIKNSSNHQLSFMNLWGEINGAKSWDANPYVWAITFKKIDRPANFLK